MKKILTLLVFLFAQKAFSQNGFCMNVLPYQPANLFTSPALASGDFNNDGYIDFCGQSAISGGPGVAFAVGIFFTNGQGSITAMSPFAINSHTLFVYLTHLISADFNNDGNQDLIAANNQDSSFFLLEGTGAGSFITTTYTVSSLPNSIVATDFNNDGKVDIAYTCVGSNSVSIRYMGTNGFLNPVNYSPVSNPGTLVPGNFNNDTYPDLFVVTGGASYFLKGTAGGTFTPTNGFALNASYVIAADINSDNQTDLVYTNINTDKIYVMKGNGNFTFNPALNYSVPGLAGSISLGRVEKGDFNSDGKMDLLAISSSYFLSILPGMGNGTFLSPVSYSATQGSFYFSNFLIADLNNDLRPDIVGFTNDFFTPFSEFNFLVNCNTVDVGIHEFEKETFPESLFPNPAQDHLSIKVTDEERLQSISIYDHLGKLVKQKELVFENGAAKINTADLEAGVYFLQLKNSAALISGKRFVIAR